MNMRGYGLDRSLARAISPVIIAAILMLAAILPTDAIAAEPKYPELAGRVTDAANILTPETIAALTTELTALEETSTDQLAVVTIPSLEGLTIEDYGVGLGRKWGIGQQGKDNGVLLIVAPNERKVRIEVGRRLEPMMTDTMSALIIQNAIIPAFRRGDWAAGISAGVRDIKDVLLGDAEEVKRRAVKGPVPPDYEGIIIFLIFAGVVGYVIWHQYRYAQQMEQTLGRDGRVRRSARRSAGGAPVIIPGGSGDWGSGWSGSSGGGGWSGGGGDFGGGGASGDW